MCYSIGRALCAFVARVLFHYRMLVEGRENFPSKGGFILASNHLSNLDPVMLGVACPRKLHFMAKKELFANRMFGAILYSVNAFPVDRGAADIKALREAMRRVRRGAGLLLFPQGGRKELTEDTKALPGVGMLARKLQVPVIPAFISGTDLALPRGESKPKKGCEFKVRFGAPVELQSGLDSERAAETIMQAIQSLRYGKNPAGS